MGSRDDIGGSTSSGRQDTTLAALVGDCVVAPGCGLGVGRVLLGGHRAQAWLTHLPLPAGL